MRENEGENLKVRTCPCPVGCPCRSQGLHCSDFTGLCHIWYRKKDHGLGTLQSGVCRFMKICRQEEPRWGTRPASGVKILRKQQDVCLNVLVSNQGDGSRDGEKLSDLEVLKRELTRCVHRLKCYIWDKEMSHRWFQDICNCGVPSGEAEGLWGWCSISSVCTCWICEAFWTYVVRLSPSATELKVNREVVFPFSNGLKEIKGLCHVFPEQALRLLTNQLHLSETFSCLINLHLSQHTWLKIYRNLLDSSSF